jgi:pimeloyl-ACP methyl ester carboxylesterase
LPPGSVVPIALPSWNGADCKDDPPPVAAYFRVPRGTEDGDFFRLPFPNDVRRDPTSGHPTLSGFPTPGPGLLGFDVIDRYVKDVEANADGFSSYAGVVMRFSGEVDFDSLKADGVVRLIDLTSGNDLGLFWQATTARSSYVCTNWMAIRPRQGEPFEPGRTYAAFLTTGAKAKGGGAITRSPDLAALLGATAPTDNFLGPAYPKYKPLRDWAASKGFDPATILNASVFTVANNDAPAKALETAINPTAAPVVKNWAKCGVTPSPCPDVTGDRACGAADPDFDEIQALVTLPIYQKGTAPYLNPPDGDLVYATGVPQKQRDEDVCMAISVPKTPMPGNGYPVVVYAHGTGGSFRSHINEGVAKMLAQVGIAVIGIDQVSHGPRRNGSTQSPDNLFFNFTNPGAARGNPLQGAADQLSLVKLARDLDLAAGSSPTGADLKFDRIAYWGHSQGATEGAIAMPYATSDVSGVLLSGAGASLIDALLSKTSPVNIAAAVPFVLMDPSGVNTGHPALGLLQSSIDPADPLNHGRAMTKNLFVPYGQKDTYTPGVVQATYVLAAGLGMTTSAPSVTTPEAIGSLSPLAVPASGNLSNPTRTGLTRQYSPAGYDGHFVVYKDATGKKDALEYLKDVAAGSPTNPRVGVP